MIMIKIMLECFIMIMLVVLEIWVVRVGHTGRIGESFRS